MSNGPWFANSGCLPSQDDDGSGISDHIRDVATDLCKFSSGGSSGTSITASFNGIKVTTRAEKTALLSLENTV